MLTFQLTDIVFLKKVHQMKTTRSHVKARRGEKLGTEVERDIVFETVEEALVTRKSE